MQFPCARCGRTYEIADELVVGRAVRVACPACGNLVVHRVPSPAVALAPPLPAPPPPPPERRRAFADADDLDFDNALAALEGPGAEAPPGAESPAAAEPSPRTPPAGPPPAPEDEEIETVEAALVALQRSNRRSRMTAAAVAAVALVALVGGGALALKWRRSAPPPGAAEARRGGGDAGGEPGAAGGLSASDLAKLMGKRPAEPEAPAAPAARPSRADDRPKHEQLAGSDKGMLDLLKKKGDAAVTVQEEDAASLSTSRASLDEQAIEGTLSRNAGSISACVNRALAADPESKLNGKRVNLELTIRPSGRVARAAMADKEIGRAPLGQCIVQAAKRMVFPGFDGEAIDIVVPIKLQVTF